MPKGTPIMGRDENGNAKIVSVDNQGNVKIASVGNNIIYGVTPTYLGIAKLGTLKYLTAEQPLPIRPWRNDQAFSVIHNNAGTSVNISFGDGNGEINIATDLFDVTMLKVGGNVIVSGAGQAGNNGTFAILSFRSNQIVVDHATTLEAIGATVTVSMNGDMVNKQDADANLDKYSFADTSTTPANVLRWHMFYDFIDGKPSLIYICDRNIISNARWDHIDASDLIFGKTVTIDGVDYLCRSLTGGAADRDGAGTDNVISYAGGLLPNEWDRYIMNGVDQGDPFFAGAPEPHNDDYLDGDQSASNEARRRAHNQSWHWTKMFSWCQETVIDNALRRVHRGANSARVWYPNPANNTSASRGFRPALVKEL